MTETATDRAQTPPAAPVATAQGHVVAKIVVQNGVQVLYLRDGEGWILTPVNNIAGFEVRSTDPARCSGDLTTVFEGARRG